MAYDECSHCNTVHMELLEGWLQPKNLKLRIRYVFSVTNKLKIKTEDKGDQGSCLSLLVNLKINQIFDFRDISMVIFLYLY